ncbi:hypothetical protein EHN46_15805 [Salmonella enterica]|nr:hypothetical protein [Salmonella enterica]
MFDGKIIQVDYPLKNKAKEQDWVDVVINRSAGTIDVFWRMAFTDGGIDGENDQLIPLSFDELKKQAKEGVEFYWSRNGSRNNIGKNILTKKGSYQVSVSACVNVSPAMSSFDLIECLDEDGGRSTSLCGFRKVYHNIGSFYNKLKGKGVSGSDITLFASQEFKLTAAHEMGHIVLDKYGTGTNQDYSWTHKGTSTILQNKRSGFPMPLSGEIDIMKYSDKKVNFDEIISRSIAANEDVNGLIWLSRIKFND